MSRSVLDGLSRLSCIVVAGGVVACGGTLDAGADETGDASLDVPVDAEPDVLGDAADVPMVPDNGLPVDITSPVIVCNDGPVDNWQGEYALLLTAQGLELSGLVISASSAWPDLDSNVEGWQRLLDAAEASGFAGLPSITRSESSPLQRPESGAIDDTEPNRSAGAQLIVSTAVGRDAGAPPLVIATGGRLTDVADAYLLEPSIADRVVVVSSLGSATLEGGAMGIPNGEMDPWANTIVLQRMSYVQVSGYYEQIQDVPSERLAELPDNAFGDWIAGKRTQIFDLAVASDQVAVLTVALPTFATEVSLVVQAGTASLGLGDTPTLAVDEAGNDWLVGTVDGGLAEQTFWELLGEMF